MASPFFRSILNPSQNFGIDDLRFMQGVNSSSKGLNFGPYSNLIGSISSGIGFFSDLFKPDYRGTGMTSQEIRQAKKDDDYRTSVQGVNFALQTLATILSFV